MQKFWPLVSGMNMYRNASARTVFPLIFGTLRKQTKHFRCTKIVFDLISSSVSTWDWIWSNIMIVLENEMYIKIKPTFQLSDKMVVCNYTFFDHSHIRKSRHSWSLRTQKKTKSLLQLASIHSRNQQGPQPWWKDWTDVASFSSSLLLVLLLHSFNSHRNHLKSLKREHDTYLFYKGKQNKLIKSIRLYLQEIQVIHSEEEGFKGTL